MDRDTQMMVRAGWQPGLVVVLGGLLMLIGLWPGAGQESLPGLQAAPAAVGKGFILVGALVMIGGATWLLWEMLSLIWWHMQGRPDACLVCESKVELDKAGRQRCLGCGRRR